MIGVDHTSQFHQEFVDPVSTEENYLIDLLAAERDLEQERTRIKELEEGNKFLDCDRDEIHDMDKDEIKKFVQSTLFLRDMYEKNKDKMELQAGDADRIADIDKNIEKWQEDERVFQEKLCKNKSVEDLFTQKQKGESSRQGNQDESESAANDKGTKYLLCFAYISIFVLYIFLFFIYN